MFIKDFQIVMVIHVIASNGPNEDFEKTRDCLDNELSVD